MTLKKVIITLALVSTIAVGCIAVLEHPAVRQRVKRKIIVTGRFHRVAHKGEGVATVYQMMSGERRLCLTEFRTGSGEGLEVYLISAADAFENETVERAERIVLGPLKRAQGEQSYPLPQGVDLDRFRAVTVWSSRYGVNFTTAPLVAP